MTSQAVDAQNTQIFIKDGETKTQIKEVKSFSGFDGQASEIDVTTLDSKAKEKRMGLQDFGGFSMDINVSFTDPGQLALQAAKAARAVKTFEIVFNDETTATFEAAVKSFTTEGAVDGVLSGKAELMITGEVIFSTAA